MFSAKEDEDVLHRRTGARQTRLLKLRKLRRECIERLRAYDEEIEGLGAEDGASLNARTQDQGRQAGVNGVSREDDFVEAFEGLSTVPRAPPGFNGRLRSDTMQPAPSSLTVSEEGSESESLQQQPIVRQPVQRSTRPKSARKAPIELYVPVRRRAQQQATAASPQQHEQVPESEVASAEGMRAQPSPPGFPGAQRQQTLPAEMRSSRDNEWQQAPSGRHANGGGWEHLLPDRGRSEEQNLRNYGRNPQIQEHFHGSQQIPEPAQPNGPPKIKTTKAAGEWPVEELEDGSTGAWAMREAEDEQAHVNAQRIAINARMDRMVPRDGTLIAENGVTDSMPVIQPAPHPKKGREWDANKPADPRQDLPENKAGWFPRTSLGNWADEPESPADGPRRGLSGRLSSRLGSGGANVSFEGMPAQNGASRFSAPRQAGPRRFEDDFPGLFTGGNTLEQRQEWMEHGAKLQEEFPSLGEGPIRSNAGEWGFGSRSIRERLADPLPFTRLAGSNSPKQSVEEFEIQAGLRHPSDDTPDAVLRKRMRSKKDFEFWERVRGREVNSVAGLELHSPVLSQLEQVQLEQTITEWVRQGTRNQLMGRTFSAPKKWARGKGRITVQFGCCYNYAVDAQGRNPGIIPKCVVEAMPPVLIALVQRLVRWNVLPRSMEPDSAIVNIYEEDDCIPPHIDHHDFSRPFCTISLLSEEEIMFGSRLVPEGPGVFHGVNGQHTLINLPVGSCLVLQGNGADVAMHCVPPVRRRRMSITLRKMGQGHEAAVRAEAAKYHAGVQNVSRSPAEGHSGRDFSPAPPGTRVNMADLIVTARSRNAVSKDAQGTRGGRWENEDAQDSDGEQGSSQRRW